MTSRRPIRGLRQGLCRSTFHITARLSRRNTWQLTAQFNISGSNLVEGIKYSDGKVWINSEQYFDCVPEEAWNAYIGGYQPAQKWLKDRKGRTLGFEDILHYLRIIHALTETQRLMRQI